MYLGNSNGVLLVLICLIGKMNQCCLHKSKSSTWGGKEKSDPNGLLYILFWEGANGGKSAQYRCLVFKKRRSSAFDDWDLLEFDSQDWSVFDSCWSSAVYFKSIPSSMFHAFCFHFVSCLLPVVYFVVEIASMCWCPIITCLLSIMFILHSRLHLEHHLWYLWRNRNYHTYNMPLVHYHTALRGLAQSYVATYHSIWTSASQYSNTLNHVSRYGLMQDSEGNGR